MEPPPERPDLVTGVLPRRGSPSDATFEVSPSTVRLSAFYREGDAIVIRLVNMDDAQSEATVALPFVCRSASAVDFLGRPVDVPVAGGGGVLHVTLQPWQIVTLNACL